MLNFKASKRAENCPFRPYKKQIIALLIQSTPKARFAIIEKIVHMYK
jgi:hypothetical protein